MLEKDFNELDNDFVTIWSKMFLRDEIQFAKERMPKGLSELAGLGQINAMQCVPFFIGYKDCNYVHDIKLNFNDDYNYELLKLNRLERKYYEYTRNYTEKAPFSIFDIKQQRVITLKKHELEYRLTKNPLILERYYEFKSKPGLITRLSTRKLRKELELLYSQDSENPMYAFAYAKNLYAFGNKHEKEVGKNILTKLSNREFSKTLMDEIEKQIQKRLSEEDLRRKENFESYGRFYSSLSDREKEIVDNASE